jgi:hypothetical protein
LPAKKRNILRHYIRSVAVSGLIPELSNLVQLLRLREQTGTIPFNPNLQFLQYGYMGTLAVIYEKRHLAKS